MISFLVNHAGADWLTLSLTGVALERAMWYCQQAMANPEPASRKLGFATYVGFSCDGLFWGQREFKDKNYGILIASGYQADLHAPVLWAMALGDECKCTRIDFQITLPSPADYDPIMFHGKLQKVSGRECGIMGIPSNGMTVSVGRRSSYTFLRIYEKGEGEEKRGFLRFEVEYKGGRSQAVWRQGLDARGYLSGEVERLLNGGTDPTLARFWLELQPANAKIPSVVSKESKTLRWLQGPVDSAVTKMLLSHNPEEREGMIELINGWLKEAYLVRAFEPEEEHEVIINP